MTYRQESPWNDANRAELRTLWERGQTTLQIGAALGCTKNAVVGQVRRMSLTPRPSPIRGRTTREAGAPKPAPRAARQQQASKPTIKAPPPVAPVRAVVIRFSGVCQYPLWGKKERPTHRYCDAPAIAGTSWCQTCSGRVFVKRSVCE